MSAPKLKGWVLKRRLAFGRVCIYNRRYSSKDELSQERMMHKGFFTRFSRPGQVDSLAPGVVPRAEAAAAAASNVAKIVKGIARKGLPQPARKAAISLRVDPEVLDWFRTQGPGYQTRMNTVLRAYMEAAQA
jgi:uncharacterized protein (DUF4415 family)